MAVHDHDFAGAFDDGGVGGHEPDGSCTVDDHGVARVHPGQLGGVPAGGENIGDHDVVELFLHGVLAQAQAVEVPVRHPQVLGLPALVRAHVREPVGCAGELGFGLHGQAVVGETAFAVFAESAGDVEGQHDTFAHLHFAHRRAGLDHFARFSCPKVRPGSKLVRPSYMCRSEPQMLVAVIRTSTSAGCSILASGTSSTADVFRSFVDYCLHFSALFFYPIPIVAK